MPSRRAALYTRVSSAAQVENYSLEYQEQQLLDYCAKHDIEIAGVYRDAGVSGSIMAERPAIRELIRDAKAGKFNEVLIYKLDRFTRADPWDLYPLVKGLMDLQVKITSITESFDLADENGQLIFSILANFAARERRLIVQRTEAGKRSLAREGKFTGGTVPFGYVVDPQTGRYVPDETPWWQGLNKADVVRLIFTKYLELNSAADVADWLIRQGVPAPRTRWNPATVNQILRNPVYCGRFAWGKRSHRLRQKSQVRRTTDWIVCENAHPAIVDQETWNRCLLRRRENKRGGRPPKEPERLLDGLLVCPRCGSTLTPRKQGNTFYYTCASRYNAARRRDGTACFDAPYWRGDLLTKAVWDAITNFVLSGEVLEQVRAHEQDDGFVRKAEQALESAKMRLADIERREEQVLELLLAGRFSRSLLDKKLSELEQQKAATRAEVYAAEKDLQSAREARLLPGDVRTLKEEIRRVLHKDATVSERRQVLMLWLARKIVVQPDGTVEIVLRAAKTPDTSVSKLHVPRCPCRSP